MTGVMSEAAETATALLFLTLAGHRTTMQALPRIFVQGRLAPPDVTTEQVQRQATLVRLMSITESFCATRLLDGAEIAIRPSANQLTSIIWDDAALVATRTWESQKDAFGKWFGVKPDWTEIDGLAEARNAVAHGLGTLTRRQLKSRSSTMAKLNRTKITVTNDRLLLTDADLVRAVEKCRDLIAELDELTR
jgi:hypothetical protein